MHSCRRPGTNVMSFSDRIIFASIFSDMTNWETRKVQDTCRAQAEKVATYAARCTRGYGCFCGPGSEKTRKEYRERPSHQFSDGEWDALALRIIGELSISKHPVFQVFEHSSSRCIGEAKERRRSLQPENHLMLVDMLLTCNINCVFLSQRKNGFRTRCQFRLILPSSN